MPAIQSITIDHNKIEWIDETGIHTLSMSDVPAFFATAGEVETWINTVGLPPLLNNYQMQVKVASLNPIVATLQVTNPEINLVSL